VNESEICLSNIIYKTYAGSMIYGTNHADSDVDIRGICVMPRNFYYGLKRFEHFEQKGNKELNIDDMTIYDIKKFFQLAMGCNPNIIELLFVAPQHILVKDSIAEKIINNRHLFISQKLYHTFKGYAYAQRQKIIDRNPIGVRKEIVDKYGYDVKFSLHLLRLLYECIELLKSGSLTLPLYCNKELLDIRLGKWKYEDVIKKAEDLEKMVDDLYVKTSIPHHPDINTIDKLLTECIEDHWRKNERISA